MRRFRAAVLRAVFEAFVGCHEGFATECAELFNRTVGMPLGFVFRAVGLVSVGWHENFPAGHTRPLLNSGNVGEVASGSAFWGTVKLIVAASRREFCSTSPASPLIQLLSQRQCSFASKSPFLVLLWSTLKVFQRSQVRAGSRILDKPVVKKR